MMKEERKWHDTTEQCCADRDASLGGHHLMVDEPLALVTALREMDLNLA
jgi:hypothetical protein